MLKKFEQSLRGWFTPDYAQHATAFLSQSLKITSPNLEYNYFYKTLSIWQGTKYYKLDLSVDCNDAVDFYSSVVKF